MSSAAVPSILMEVHAAYAEPRKIRLIQGERFETLTLGRCGEWQIHDEGVYDLHAALHFDGSLLYVVSAQDTVVFADGQAVGPEWFRLELPVTLHIGAATLVIHGPELCTQFTDATIDEVLPRNAQTEHSGPELREHETVSGTIRSEDATTRPEHEVIEVHDFQADEWSERWTTEIAPAPDCSIDWTEEETCVTPSTLEAASFVDDEPIGDEDPDAANMRARLL